MKNNNSESKLKESEYKLDIIFKGAKEGFIAADAKTKKFVLINSAMCKITGYSLKELLRSDISKIHLKKDLPYVIQQFSKILHKEISIAKEIPVLRKDKKIVYCNINASIIEHNGKQLLLGFFRDVTAEKKAKEELKESEEKFRNFFENSNDAIFIADARTRKLVDCNKKAEKLTEYSKTKLLSMNAGKLHPEDRVKETMEGFKKQMERKIELVETEVLTKSGKRIPVSVNASLIESNGKNYLLGIFRNITERKKAEDEMRLFRGLVENSSDAIGMSTPEGKHYYQNEAFSNLFGNIGKHPPETVFVDKAIGKKVFDTIMGGESWQGELKMFKKDGTILDIFERAYAIKNSSGHILGLAGLHTDITEKKKTEDELLRKNKELEEFNQFSVDREIKMIELKKEINTLLKNLGKSQKYSINEKESKNVG